MNFHSGRSLWYFSIPLTYSFQFLCHYCLLRIFCSIILFACGKQKTRPRDVWIFPIEPIQLTRVDYLISQCLFPQDSKWRRLSSCPSHLLKSILSISLALSPKDALPGECFTGSCSRIMSPHCEQSTYLSAPSRGARWLSRIKSQRLSRTLCWARRAIAHSGHLLLRG